MIITESKPFGIIKTQLKKDDKISLLSCDSCAKFCGTGGKEGLMRIKDELLKEGFNVVDETIIPVMCDMDLYRNVKPKGNVIIVLACDAGVFCVKKLFRDKKIIAALDTRGLGAFDKEGELLMIREFKE